MKKLFLTISALLILNNTYAQVKATSSEINTGTDDDKFATALALQGSKYLDQNGGKVSAVTAVGANVYVASIAPAITAYSLGQVFYIKIITANTGASTLNLNGLGAKALVKDANTPLISGDLFANKVYAVYYDGTNFQVLNVAVAPVNQTLSLGTTPGNISISGGNNVTLSTLTLSNNTDANALSPVGFSTYLNTTGSLNFPSATGAGIRVNRTGTTSTLGQFEIWKEASNTSHLFYRTGSGTSTFNPWKVIADREWANLEFSRRGLGTSAGINSIRVNDTRGVNDLPSELSFTTSFDFKSVGTLGLPLGVGFAATTTFIPYVDLSGNNSAAYRMAHSAGNLYFQNAASQSAWGSWKTIADRDWTTANFAPATGAGYLPLTGGNLSGPLNINTTSNSSYAAKVENQGTTNAHGLYVNIGSISTGVPLLVAKNASPLLTINSSGSAVVAGEVTARTVNATSSDQSESRITISNTASVGRKWGLVAGISGVSQAGFSIFDYTAGAGTRLTVVDNGNIGISTNTPTEKLEVNGNVKAIGATLTGPLNASAAYFSSTVRATTSYLLNGAAATIRSLAYQTNSVNRWYVYTDQGAETGSNAGSNFNIARYSDAGVYLSNALIINRASGNATFSNTVSAPTFIGDLTGNASTASAMAWTGVTGKPTTLAGYGITDAATQASVTTLDGNAVHKTGNETIAGVKLFSTSVGIGTTNVHSYKLAVGGGIIAESVKVKPQVSWPDYVFEKDYPILPLNELEKFVLKNKHLPNVPNAAEVKKEGIDVGEMNAKLLQKIEELTLYIIEQQKNISDQQLNIIDQQKEIKNLKGKVNEMTRLSEVVEKLSAEMNLLKKK